MKKESNPPPPRVAANYERELKMIELGKTYTDKVSGFTGVATAYVRYLSGCNQGLIIPKVGKDGNYREGQWFDEQKLTEDPKQKQIVLENRNAPGFDKPAPKR
jgi:hypothetical protein